MRIVVIGSGFGGLAAAIRLQAQGHAVTIVEKQAQPGGRAAVFRQDGFTFDAGPTILTAPWMIEELFSSSGRAMADYVTLRPIDPFYTIRFPDGTAFHCTADEEWLRRQIAAFEPRDVKGYERLRREMDRIYEAGFPLVDRPFTTVMDMLRVAPDLIRLRAHRSVSALVDRHILDPRLRQVFSFHPLLIGGNPFDTTSIYGLIHSLEMRGGVWFAMGGTGALVAGLCALFRDLGGELLLDSPVTRIETDPVSLRATAVWIDGATRLAADAVVSNADVASTYLDLIETGVRRRNTDRRIRRLRYSMSLFVLYFGTNRRYEDIGHHEILMGPRYRELLADIFGQRPLAEDFSLYLHRPTATDTSLAPAGGDAFYVLSPVPHLGAEIDWSETAGRYRDAIVRELEARYLPDLSRHIVTERMIDPRYFRDALGSHLGSAFSVQPILTQSAWFRPHNLSEDVPNLYIVGAGTHPGAGVPGVLASGKIAADMIGPATSSAPSGVARRAEAFA